jgi:hypothetical protein
MEQKEAAQSVKKLLCNQLRNYKVTWINYPAQIILLKTAPESTNAVAGACCLPMGFFRREIRI